MTQEAGAVRTASLMEMKLLVSQGHDDAHLYGLAAALSRLKLPASYATYGDVVEAVVGTLDDAGFDDAALFVDDEADLNRGFEPLQFGRYSWRCLLGRLRRRIKFLHFGRIGDFVVGKGRLGIDGRCAKAQQCEYKQ